jgi:hypothetical protein
MFIYLILITMSLINLSTIIRQLEKTPFNKDAINIDLKISDLLKKINNENFETFMFDYINLNDIYDIQKNENVMLYPIPEKHEQKMHILNAILSITNENYINLKYVERLNIIQQHNFDSYLKNIQCNLYIIIDEITVEFYDNGFTKNIVIVKYKNYFFSVINILDNYYDNYDDFILCLKMVYENMKHLKLEINTDEDGFVEYYSENQPINEDKNENTIFKKNKKTKNIFITMDEEVKNVELIEDKKETTFIKTIEVNKDELLKKTKMTLTLGELQNIATQLNISIVAGLTKTNNPKNKTKLELYNNIVDCLKK